MSCLPGTSNLACMDWMAEEKDSKFQERQGQFAAQEYLQILIRKDRADIARLCEIPEGMSLNLWAYEHLRQVLLELNKLVTLLQHSCTKETCPTMMATPDYTFLCANHGPTPMQCSAVDYTLHSLAAYRALLNNSTIFPSRVKVADKSAKHFRDVIRRLWRIFAHCYFHHREIFDDFEQRTHLCRRFTVFSTQHGLVTPEQLVPSIEF